MPNTLDFLFEGQPPQSVTTYGQTVENIPKWMSDYTQGLIARANAAAAEPYIPYGGPRIAGFTGEQQDAFGLTQENVGSWQPYVEGSARGYSGGLEAAGNIAASADPYLQQAQGSFSDPGVAQQYMDPYIGNVMARQAEESNRNLTETYIPQLQGIFTSAGTYGSRGGQGSMQDIGTKGFRDIADSLQGQQLAALSGAYENAGTRYEAERGRYGELGRIRGALEEAGMQGMYQGAEGMGRLGSEAQRMGLTDAAALEGIGAQQQQLNQRSLDTAYQDFLEQRNLPFDRLGFMSNIVRGLPMDRMVTQQDTGPANIYQPSPLSQIVGAYGTYRGLTGEAEGGYIEPGKYANGGYVEDNTEYDYYIPEQEYGLGGLARAAGAKLVGMGKRAAGALSDWARSLYPDFARTLGVGGGKLLKLDHKQD